MSFEIKATTAVNTPTTATATTAMSASRQCGTENTIAASASTNINDKNTGSQALYNEAATKNSPVNSSDITDLNSVGGKASPDTQHFQRPEENQCLLAQTTVSPLLPCVENPENVLSNGSKPVEQQEDDDDAGSVELRDTLRSNYAGGAQQAFDSDSQEHMSPGLSLLQAAAASSPPPHSYRHSRAYRHFKNPPQPHMCIRTTTETGEELFINVLSWTRIVIPQEPSDPIPLYGGMRVPPGSPRSPPIVFAVMANPEVLKDSGRHSKDPEERRAMVELMCDFVEAMNPGVKLVRNAVILKDRDISGELKDVWNAVQAQRDREREEQMLQQRQQQQQHFHNLATNATTNGGASNGCGLTSAAVLSAQQQQLFSKSVLGGMGEGSPPRSRKSLMQDTQSNENFSMDTNNIGECKTEATLLSASMLSEEFDKKMTIHNGVNETQQTCIRESWIHESHTLANVSLSNGNECKDFIDSVGSEAGGGQHKNDVNNQLNANNNTSGDIKFISQNHTNGTSSTKLNAASCNANKTDALPTPNINISASNSSKGNCNISVLNTAVSTPPLTSPTPSLHVQTVAVTAPPPPTKKEKLGGFLPNGCIFPRFTKNNKHKDKDKEGKTKDKEKNVLLSALKKSKDKKSQHNTTHNANQDQQQNELINTNNTSATNSSANNYTANIPIGQHQQSSSATAINNHHNTINNSTAIVQSLENDVKRLDINRTENNKFTSSSAPLPNSNIVSNNSPVNAINKDSNTNNRQPTAGVDVH